MQFSKIIDNINIAHHLMYDDIKNINTKNRLSEWFLQSPSNFLNNFIDFESKKSKDILIELISSGIDLTMENNYLIKWLFFNEKEDLMILSFQNGIKCDLSDNFFIKWSILKNKKKIFEYILNNTEHIEYIGESCVELAIAMQNDKILQALLKKATLIGIEENFGLIVNIAIKNKNQELLALIQKIMNHQIKN